MIMVKITAEQLSLTKKETQKIYLDFIGEPTDSPRRSQQGIYTSYTLGPPGRRVKLILLDNRYHRTENDVLGAAQWKWLRGELENSDAQIHIFGAGLQIIADDKQSMWPDLESFSLYGKSNQRLYDVLVETKTRGALLLSGDIHLSEINVLHCTGLGYPLFDITSSGMTHVWPWADTWIERTLYDLIFRHLLPGRFVVGGARFAQLNYGTLDIDWESSPVIVRAHIHGVDGKVHLSQNISIGEFGSANSCSSTLEVKERTDIQIPTFVKVAQAVSLAYDYDVRHSHGLVTLSTLLALCLAVLW
eukprot:520249_1